MSGQEAPAEDTLPSDDPIKVADRSESGRVASLPTLNKIKHDIFKRIDAATLVKIIDGVYKDIIDSFTIVDCRYPYEYAGGHIVNSVNIHSESDLLKLLLEDKTYHCLTKHIVIFHCEFSSERGPRLMHFLRERDRQMNKYPQLTYPDVYLLDGGYSLFYRHYKEYCVPQTYQPMKSRNHREELLMHRKKRKVNHNERFITPLDISFEG